MVIFSITCIGEEIVFIKNIIPDKVWLSSIVYNKNKIVLIGNGLSDVEVNNFLSSLENKSFFTNILLKKSSEVISEKKEKIREFEINCDLETKNE